MNTRTQSLTTRSLLGLLVALTVLSVAACGGTGTDEPVTESSGIRVVTPLEAADLLEDEPGNRLVLDVRTPEEFGEGHLDGAVLIDFYNDDFKETLAELDPDLPYVIYCRSGNRSGQTREILADLGFSDVVDIEGGIIAWEADELPTVG